MVGRHNAVALDSGRSCCESLISRFLDGLIAAGVVSPKTFLHFLAGFCYAVDLLDRSITEIRILAKEAGKRPVNSLHVPCQPFPIPALQAELNIEVDFQHLRIPPMAPLISSSREPTFEVIRATGPDHLLGKVAEFDGLVTEEVPGEEHRQARIAKLRDGIV
jgi:hypothetical protein